MVHAPRGGDANDLHPGDVLDVRVDKAVYRGLGLARHEGQVVFVPRVWPGERARVRIVSRERGYVRAEPLDLLEMAPARRPSPCSYVPECGGCAYQELDYAEQLALKLSVLRETLARGGIAWDAEIPCEPSPEQGWRLRAGLHFDAGPPARLGLHTERSRRVVDLAHCRQLSDGLNAVARALRDALSAGAPRLAAAVREVEVCESQCGAWRVASLGVEADLATAGRLRRIAVEVPALTGLGVVARERGVKRFVALAGEPFADARVLGARLRFHVRSFFQSNRFLAEPLARRVCELVTDAGEGPVLDLYAGVGLFAVPLAAAGLDLRAAELSPTAATDLRANARAAGVAGLGVFCGDVRAALGAWPRVPGERVILDPPRTGAGADVVAAVAARRPSVVVYVSCDPATLARDIKLLASHGYSLATLHAFDLFPDTFHVETVVSLRPTSD